MLEIDDILFSCTWLILYLILQFCTWIILRAWLSSKLALPASFAASLLFSCLISWYLAWLGFSPTFTLGIFFILTGIVLGTVQKARIAILSDLNEGKWYYALFFTVFLTFLVVRMFFPDIRPWGWEKVANYAYFASMIRTPVVPPLDPWFAGGTLETYYYLGHWCFATLVGIAHIPPWIGFHFISPTVASVSAVQLYGIGKLLLKKFSLLPVILLFIPNPMFIASYINGVYFYNLLMSSTGAIPGAVSEYPLYTFLLGDAHAHAMGVFNQTFFILMIVYLFTQWQKLIHSERAICALLVGISLGSMVGMNVWNAFSSVPLFFLAAIVIWYQTHSWEEQEEFCGVGTWFSKVSVCLYNDISYLLKKRTEISNSGATILYLWILVPLIAFLSYAPFFIMMTPYGSQGIGIVHTKTMLPEFFLALGWFVFLLVCTLYSDIKKRPKLLIIAIPFIIVGYSLIGLILVLLAYLIARHEGISDLLLTCGLLLTLVCELVYVMDFESWSSFYRLNTLWKAYYVAWFFLGVGALCSASIRVEQFMDRVCHERKRDIIEKYNARLVIGGILILILLCDLVYIIASNSWGRWYRLSALWTFYFVAWLLLGIGALCSTNIHVEQFMNRVCMRRKGAIIEKCITRLVIGAIVVLILWTPILNHELGYVSHPEIQGLDGFSWMGTQTIQGMASPEDYAVVRYLRELHGEYVLVESGGNLFHTRISSATGIPALLGNVYHIAGLRRDNPPGWWLERTTDIAVMYEHPERALEIMEKHNVDFLILGPPERAAYQVPDDTSAYLADLVPIFISGETTVYQRIQE